MKGSLTQIVGLPFINSLLGCNIVYGVLKPWYTILYTQRVALFMLFETRFWVTY